MGKQIAPARAFGSPKPFRAKPRLDSYVTGRPTEYRPEYCEHVIAFMGEGFDLTAFAGDVGVARETVYRWINAHAEFRNAVNIGKAKRSHALQRKLLSTKMGVGVTAAIFALKNAEPDDWQDRYNTVTDVTVRIETLSDEQLLAIAGQSADVLTIEHEPTPKAQHADER